jgi:HEAT repeat protein
LIEALHDKDPDVRCTAAGQLGYLGSNGAERAKALVPLLNDDAPYVRQQAAWSLEDIGNWDRDPEARETATNALRKWNPETKRDRVRE